MNSLMNGFTNSNSYENQMRGIFFMLIACAFFAINNNLIKYLSVSVSPICMVFYKNFISFLLLFPFLLFVKGRVFSAKHFNKYNFLRGFIDVVSIAFWFKAVEGAPISQAVAITFLTPFFITLIAMFALKERVDFAQWGLMLVGLAGALVVIQPTFNFNFHILYAIFASILWAISAVLFKKLTLIQDSFIIIFFLKGIKSFMALPLLIYDFQVLSGNQLLFLICLGIVANFAMYFVSLAYKCAKISVVVPFDFSRLVLTSFIAFFIFDEAMSFSTFYGSAVILIASSLLAGRTKKRQ